MTSFDVLILGDCNPDIVLSDPDAQVRFGQHESVFRHGGLTAGGSASITACACARLGLKTMFVGAVGQDLPAQPDFERTIDFMNNWKDSNISRSVAPACLVRDRARWCDALRRSW
jgi:hypothetical protein